MKTVLITGVSRGIGKALAQKFLAEGYEVIGTYLDGTIDYSHQNLKVFQLDLASDNSVMKFSEDIRSIGNNVDILINNAGALFDEDDTRVIIDKLRKTLEVNLVGTINLTEKILPLVNADGHIVNISSSAGSLIEADFNTPSHYPYHYPAYKISKAAINMYTRTLAMRLAHEEKSSIVVSSVHPGWVKTEMGGPEAEIAPEEAAENIYALAISRPETGQFWFKGEKYPW